MRVHLWRKRHFTVRQVQLIWASCTFCRKSGSVTLFCQRLQTDDVGRDLVKTSSPCSPGPSLDASVTPTYDWKEPSDAQLFNPPGTPHKDSKHSSHLCPVSFFSWPGKAQPEHFGTRDLWSGGGLVWREKVTKDPQTETACSGTSGSNQEWAKQLIKV